MRYFSLLVVPLLLCSCAPAPNQYTQQLDRLLLLRGGMTTLGLSIDAFQQQKNVTTEIDDDEKTKIKASATYVAPFEDCSRIPSTFHYKRTGFAGSERAYNYVYKICALGNERYQATLLAPQIDGVTGVADIIDRTPKASKEAAAR